MIYRITYKAFLLVEADDVQKAIKIGSSSLSEEIPYFNDVEDIEEITNEEQLYVNEQRSLPWRDRKRTDDELTVNEILQGKK